MATARAVSVEIDSRARYHLTITLPASGRAGRLLFLVALWPPSIFLAKAPQTTAPAPSASELKLDTGKQIYEAACIGCHGPGGRGQPQTTLGFEPPATFPDFSDCPTSTPERTFDWRATIHEGGRGRGFSEIMPSFAEALTVEQIDKVAKYLRTLCSEPDWPLGELNLPRPLITEKAFPETETVLTIAANANGAGALSSDFIYEQRFGVKNHFEFSVPVNFSGQGTGTWAGGVGDLAFGVKQVLAHSSRTGSIFSVQGEVSAPTGNREKGLGSGVTTFEAFGAFGQILPHFSFFQIQAGVELPTDTDKAPKAVFWRTALGRTFTQHQNFGRSWSPMVEILADRDLETGADTNWDIVPEMQVTLNKRQHIRVNIGIRTPINNTAGRSTQVMVYALWDRFDGGLREGW